MHNRPTSPAPETGEINADPVIDEINADDIINRGRAMKNLTFFKQAPIPHVRKIKLLTMNDYSEIYYGTYQYQEEFVSIKMQSQNSLADRDSLYLQYFDFPYIAKVIATLKDPYPCLILEPFVGTLDTALQFCSSHLLSGNCLQIACNIAKALAYLHERNFILCNLHPNNILLNDKIQAKLVDMRYVSKSQTMQLHGTLSYLSPEAINKNKNESPSDIYNFGVILLEIFYRHYDPSHYFASSVICATEDIPEEKVKEWIINGTMQQNLLTAIETLEVKGRCSDSLTTLMRQCIHEDPQQRPTAVSIAKELEMNLCLGNHAFSQKISVKRTRPALR